MHSLLKTIGLLLFIQLPVFTNPVKANDFIDFSFLVIKAGTTNINSNSFWSYLNNNSYSGLEVEVVEQDDNIVLKDNHQDFNFLLDKIEGLLNNQEETLIPVFLYFDGNVNTLDSVIKNSVIAEKIFYLPLGEAWPTSEYLVQANRRIIFFISGDYSGESRILHRLDNYVLKISGNDIAGTSVTNHLSGGLNPELFMIDELDKLPVRPSSNITNLVPDYINYLLENWTAYGKKPNFLFVGENYSNYNLTVSQLNSFSWVNGTVKYAGKILEKVYWKNPVVTITNGKFSFPIRGGEEIILLPFAPGFNMTPQQIIVTGEMEVPESYSIIATPISLSEGLSGSFSFENEIKNSLNPTSIYEGENFSFTQDIERGNVLKLPENSNINLGSTENYGLRNSSFTVSCFVKFTEILEFGDNAIIGNNESGYRKGFHLILRSGHPYFGLWANDYISDEILRPNVWYHLVWRYIIETGEQAIFLNGRNIGNSDGHPPFSGTGDIHIGSALSSGASLRGYIDDLYFWNRPLGMEEINRLTLNENVVITRKIENTGIGNDFVVKWGIGALALLLLFVIILLFIKRNKTGKSVNIINLPNSDSANQIRLFGKFLVIDKDAKDVSALFTPKVRELFLYILIYTTKNGNGANVTDVNENLWAGISSKKVANNRAVTLNKLRRILNRIDGIEVVTQNGFLQIKTTPGLFCDFIEAYQLCQTPGEMSKAELELFFRLVKKGPLLKEMDWPWLDEIRGLTGNQVMDNLLKLGTIYFKENKLDKIEAISRRILEYDDMSEEAVYMQIMVLQKTNNIHLARFNFKSFLAKYKENLGEEYPFNFEEFNTHYSKLLQF
jgi:two-component SAPR family response regulator